MRARTRFWVITALLMGTLGVCVTATVGAMKQDLLARSQGALATAGIPFYGLAVSGRDVVLHGLVASREHATEIAHVVASVVGVRDVRDALVVERIVAPAAVARLRPPSLRIQRLGERVFIAGRLPEGGSAERIRAAAELAFGRANVSSDLRTDASIETPDWVSDGDRVIELMAAVGTNGRLSIEGESALLFGLVRDSAERQRLIDASDRIGALRWQYELMSLDGATHDIGGGP